MPRMHVNLRPSTISFDDGENPVVSGIARLGAAMAALPPQLQHLRMQQAAVEEDKHRFNVAQDMREREFSLHQGADARAGEEHDLRMQTGKAAAIRSGDIDPPIADPLNLTPEDEHNIQLEEQGRELRDAKIEHLKMQGHGTGNTAAPRWIPVTDKDTGETLRMNERTGEVQPLHPPRASTPGAAPAAPAGEMPPTDQYVDNGVGGLVRSAWSALTRPDANDGNGAIRGMTGGNQGPIAAPAAPRQAPAAPGAPALTPGPQEQALHAELQRSLGAKDPELAGVAFQTLMGGHSDDILALMTDHPEVREIVRRHYGGAARAPAAAPVASALPPQLPSMSMGY